MSVTSFANRIFEDFIRSYLLDMVTILVRWGKHHVRINTHSQTASDEKETRPVLLQSQETQGSRATAKNEEEKGRMRPRFAKKITCSYWNLDSHYFQRCQINTKKCGKCQILLGKCFIVKAAYASKSKNKL